LLSLCFCASASQNNPRKKQLTFQDFLPKTLADALSSKNQRKEIIKRSAIADIVAAKQIESSPTVPVALLQPPSKSIIAADLPEPFDIKRMESELHNNQKQLPKYTVADILDNIKRIELLKDTQPEEFHDKLANLYFEIANLEQTKRLERAKYLEQFRSHANQVEEIKKLYQPLEHQIEQLKAENNFFQIIPLYEQLIVLSQSEKRSNHYQTELAKIKNLCVRQGLEKAITAHEQTENYTAQIVAYQTLAQTYDSVEEKAAIEQKIAAVKEKIQENEYQKQLADIEKEQQTIIGNKTILNADELHQVSLCFVKKINVAKMNPHHKDEDHSKNIARAERLHYEAMGKAQDNAQLLGKIRSEYKKPKLD